jgi:hypothetical protein
MSSSLLTFFDTRLSCRLSLLKGPSNRKSRENKVLDVIQWKMNLKLNCN